MAESKKVEGNDLIADDYLKEAITQANEYLIVLGGIKTTIKETNKITSDQLKKSKGSSSKDLKEQNALMNESKKQRTAVIKLEQQELDAINRLNKAKAISANDAKKKLGEDDKAKKAIEAQTSAYAKASKNLTELRKQYRDLAIQGKSADAATQQLLHSIQQIDKDLKKVDADMGIFTREVGNYKGAMKEAIAETGIFSAGINKLGGESEAIAAGFGKIVGQLQELKKAEDAGTKGAFTLKNALKATGIAALVATIAALFSYITSSRKGALQFDLVLNKIKGTIDIVFRSISNLFVGLTASFQASTKQLEYFYYKATFQTDKAAIALKEYTDLSISAQTQLQDAFSGSLDSIDKQITAYDELSKAIAANEDKIRSLDIVRQQANLDEEDFNEIAADTTRSLNEQKKALNDAAAQRRISATASVGIAKLEYSNAQKQLQIDLRKNGVSEQEIKLLEKTGYREFLNGKNTLNVTEEGIKAIHEKFLAQVDAADKLDDLNRQEAMRRRQIDSAEIISQLELLRSKKLGADAAVQILTKQVADEKNQLEDRANLEEELRNKQLTAQAEEVRLIAKFKTSKDEQAISEEKINELINEQDALKLAQNIKLLRDERLSEEQANELAKIILEAQNNKIAYEDQLAKLQDERIRREQKLSQLNQEIDIINKNSVLTDIQNIEQQRQKILDDSNTEILQGYNVFNKKLLDQRQRAAIDAEGIAEAEAQVKIDLIKKQYELDQENINNTVNDQQIKDKELEKLQASYNANIAKANIDANNKQDELKLKQQQSDQAVLVREFELYTETIQKATQALSNELDRRQQIQNTNAEYQISKTQNMIDQQQSLAERGLSNSLAYEQELRDKQLLAQQDAAKKQAKQKQDIALAEALLNAYNSELKQPNATPTAAAGKALADVLLFKGLASGIVQFAADGNDDVQGPGTTRSDSIPFMLSKHEGVVKADANINNPGVVAALNSDTFDQKYMPKFDMSSYGIDTGSMAHNISNSILMQSNKEVIRLLEKIEKKPTQHIDVDKLGNLIETVHENGIKTVTKYKNRRSLG